MGVVGVAVAGVREGGRGCADCPQAGREGGGETAVFETILPHLLSCYPRSGYLLLAKLLLKLEGGPQR